MGEIVGAMILGVVGIACFIVSWFQFHEKGFLLNNAYIYASKKERESMNKKPYYKQSGVVFVFIGILFLINAVELIFQTDWLLYVVIGMIVVMMTYAIVSSVMIEKRK